MRKVPIYAFFWTIALALPFTLLALGGLAYVTENYHSLANGAAELSRSLSVGGRGLLVQAAERWPEIAGMALGQAVLMLILLLTRPEGDGKKIETPLH